MNPLALALSGTPRLPAAMRVVCAGGLGGGGDRATASATRQRQQDLADRPDRENDDDQHREDDHWVHGETLHERAGRSRQWLGVVAAADIWTALRCYPLHGWDEAGRCRVPVGCWGFGACLAAPRLRPTIGGGVSFPGRRSGHRALRPHPLGFLRSNGNRRGALAARASIQPVP